MINTYVRNCIQETKKKFPYYAELKVHGFSRGMMKRVANS